MFTVAFTRMDCDFQTEYILKLCRNIVMTEISQGQMGKVASVVSMEFQYNG